MFYVAMTRAKDALHLMLPARFYTHGQAARGDPYLHAIRSRFLPRHVVDKFDQPSFKPRAARPGGSVATAAPRPQAPDDEHVGVDGISVAWEHMLGGPCALDRPHVEFQLPASPDQSGAHRLADAV